MRYEDYLELFIEKVFIEASKKWTWKEFAEHSGLAYTTVYNLGMYKTKRPQLRTVFRMAQAVGMELPAIHKRRLKLVG